jgi:arylsulfatase A-like enzyme
MMADDLGYNDPACYGQKLFSTPAMDKLAKEGIRLTDAYSPSAVCSPTRYAVLTGTSPFRNYRTSHVLFNGEPLVIGTNEKTVASLLKTADYKTGVIGKWHLGLGDRIPRNINSPGRGPNDVGFDYSFIVPDGHNMFPRYYMENGEILGGTNPLFKAEPVLLDRLGYKLLRNEAVGPWDNRRPEDQIGATLADKVDGFIKQNKDHPFFLYYTTCSVHDPQIPDPRFVGKSGMGPHGDFVLEFDWAVGRVMETLDRLGLAENTLFIVTSDNGGLPQVKNTNHRPSAPWRGCKESEYEGGHRVPFFARWPKHIPANTISHRMVSLVDLAATAAALTKTGLPKNAALDSFNMLPVLTDTGDSGRPYIVTGRRGMTRLAIRQGDWKLIVSLPNETKTELFNLREDPGETKNVTTDYPEKTDALRDLLQAYAKRGSSRPDATGTPSGFDQVFSQKEDRNQLITREFQPSDFTNRL